MKWKLGRQGPPGLDAAEDPGRTRMGLWDISGLRCGALVDCVTGMCSHGCMHGSVGRCGCGDDTSVTQDLTMCHSGCFIMVGGGGKEHPSRS